MTLGLYRRGPTTRPATIFVRRPFQRNKIHEEIEQLPYHYYRDAQAELQLKDINQKIAEQRKLLDEARTKTQSVPEKRPKHLFKLTNQIPKILKNKAGPATKRRHRHSGGCPEGGRPQSQNLGRRSPKLDNDRGKAQQ